MSSDVDIRSYIRCTPLETATGWVHGLGPATPLPETSVSPRDALDDAIRPFLLQPPCFITFSGGRDSSAVLAAATDLARREGHALPIPVTRVYPHLPDTEETQWQRSVIGHLGLVDWIRFEFTSDETDLLGDAAREAVTRRGVVWPPAFHTHGAMFDRLGEGSLLTGEGGDAILGFRRSSALNTLRRRRRPSSRLLALAAVSLLPRPVRAATLRRTVRARGQHTWLRPAAFEAHVRAAAADESGEPLRYDTATWYIARRRMFSVLSHNCAVGAAEFGIASSDPLLDAGFVAALARSGGTWGYTGRTETMRVLFADVLPPATLSRRSKASFNHAHTGAATRWFAERWDGTGVDRDLVDVDELRRIWLSNEPTMATGLLLHSAWLASGCPTP